MNAGFACTAIVAALLPACSGGAGCAADRMLDWNDRRLDEVGETVLYQCDLADKLASDASRDYADYQERVKAQRAKCDDVAAAYEYVRDTQVALQAAKRGVSLCLEEPPPDDSRCAHRILHLTSALNTALQASAKAHDLAVATIADLRALSGIGSAPAKPGDAGVRDGGAAADAAAVERSDAR